MVNGKWNVVERYEIAEQYEEFAGDRPIARITSGYEVHGTLTAEHLDGWSIEVDMMHAGTDLDATVKTVATGLKVAWEHQMPVNWEAVPEPEPEPDTPDEGETACGCGACTGDPTEWTHPDHDRVSVDPNPTTIGMPGMDEAKQWLAGQAGRFHGKSREG